MSISAKDNFNLETFARDVISHQLELVGYTSKIGWPSLPENRYRWPDYIQAVSRTVSVLRLSQREKYVEWFSDYYSGNTVLHVYSLKLTLKGITDPKIEELKYQKRLNVASLHTMFLLALCAEASLVCYLKEELDLIIAVTKWWQGFYKKHLLNLLRAEGGLDALKRWGDHIAYIDQDITPEYIRSIYLPDNKYSLVESDLEELVREAKSNFVPDLENVLIYFDGTLRFLDIMPLSPLARAKLYFISTAKIKTENSDLLVRLGVIPVESRDTLSIYSITKRIVSSTHTQDSTF